ncbi:MAG: hypothetical protein LC799_01650 [Actinobacteria bacterium]|nr:hypothetical protein [Actinomycetota bacterium]
MSKKRYLAAFGAAGLVFAGVFGAAAALDITSGNAQAGVDSLSCDSDGVKIDGLKIEQGTGLGPESLGVKVSGISADCAGYFLTGRALGKGDTLITLTNAVAIPATGGTVHLNWVSSPQLVQGIEKVGLAIT